MAIKDIKSNLFVVNAGVVEVSADGTTDTAIIDTANYELGLMFTLSISGFTDGVYDLVLRESNNADFSDSVVVPNAKVIGLPDPLIAETAEGDQVYTVGLFSNLRYVRAVVQASGVTTGATASVLCVQKAEIMPVENI